MLLLQNFFLQVQVISLLHSLVFIPKELLLGGGFFLLLELAFGKEIGIFYFSFIFCFTFYLLHPLLREGLARKTLVLIRDRLVLEAKLHFSVLQEALKNHKVALNIFCAVTVLAPGDSFVGDSEPFRPIQIDRLRLQIF